MNLKTHQSPQPFKEICALKKAFSDYAQNVDVTVECVNVDLS